MRIISFIENHLSYLAICILLNFHFFFFLTTSGLFDLFGICCAVVSRFGVLTVCDPPGSSVQARTLEWVAVPSSRGSAPPRDHTRVSNVSRFGREQLYHWRHLGSLSLCLALGNRWSEKMQALTSKRLYWKEELKQRAAG